MFGIFVENTRTKYASAIVLGLKSIETRKRNVFKSIIGKKVAVIKTAKNHKPMIIGYVKIASAIKANKALFDTYFNKHCVPPGSKYDCPENGFKWLYFLDNPETCFPYEIPQDAIRHGYSFIEFNEKDVI